MIIKDLLILCFMIFENPKLKMKQYIVEVKDSWIDSCKNPDPYWMLLLSTIHMEGVLL